MKANDCFNDIIWLCSQCKSIATDMNHPFMKLLSSLQERVSSLEAQLKQQPNLISASATTSTEQFPPLSRNLPHTNPHQSHQVLLIPGDKEKLSMEKFCDIAKKNLPNIPIKNIGITKKGHGFVNLPDKENCEKVISSLQKEYNVVAKTNDQRSFMPKITISDINGDDYSNSNKEELKTAIMNKNPTIKSCIEEDKQFDILFLTEDKVNKTAKAVCRVHPDILNAVKNLRYKIYVDFGTCRVNDRFYLKQCYRCQKFGHRNNDCPLKQANKYVCRYCSSDHQSSSCPHKLSKTKENFKCANCNGQHNTTDTSCPVLQKRVDYIISKTLGFENFSKNSMNRHAIVT